MGRFRDAMTRDMLLREFAPSTQDNYLRCARGLVAFYRRPPDALNREDVLRYAEHLRQRGLSPASRGVHHAAIRFLYRVTLRRPEVIAGLGSPKVPRRKARALRGGEIQRLWKGITDAKYRALFCVTYGCGLRVSEACGLLTADVDGAHMRLAIRGAKGAKGRYVPLSAVLITELRAYCAGVLPRHSSFSAGGRTAPGGVGRDRSRLPRGMDSARTVAARGVWV
ncbi:MAG: phage integrase N-terminal SAM-like domain-containing protein [Myxococcota bacterium]